MPATPLTAIRWSVLARHLASRLPDAVRFQGGAIRDERIEIDVYYRGEPPRLAELEVQTDDAVVEVRVRTHMLPRPVAPLEFAARGGTAFTGVHPGAAIAIEGAGGNQLAAICALLAPRATGAPPAPSHLITCGHVFPPGAAAARVIAARGPRRPEVVIGTLEVNLLDRAEGAIDVALVRLSAEGVALAQIVGPGPRLEGILPANSIFNLEARTWRPTLGDYSPPTQTAGVVIHAHIASAQWPNGFDVTGVLATLESVSIPGDSGTVLSTHAGPVNAIGSCSASDGAGSLFEPLDRALARLHPTYQLKLWSNL